MPDWSKSMQQTFEYYLVDPGTWKDIKIIEGVKQSSTVDRDSEVDTLGSAMIDFSDTIDETYIRIYLITIQNGVKEKHPLGTFLVQTLPTSFDGKVKTISLDAYTPLIELNEKYLPIGYYVPKEDNSGNKTNIMKQAYMLARENMRAPVVNVSCNETLHTDFVADISDTYLKFIKSLIANAEYELGLDEMGRLLFLPKQDLEALQPVWIYTDDNSSILYPDISMDRDLYGIPNVVEVLAANGNEIYYGVAKNDDIHSPTSIQNRGREIVYRDTSPEIIGVANQDRVNEYAQTLLKTLSTLEYTITYTHAYCGTRVGDCVMINYSKFGLNNVKAKIISQSLKLVPGCPVTEKAIFTHKLWRK